MNNPNQTSPLRFARTFLIVVAVLIVFAYGFQVTEIDLEEPKDAKRQEQLTNVIRSLARPDLTTSDIERIEVNAPILVPCPTTLFNLPDLSQPGPSLKLSTGCAAPGSEVTVRGADFAAGDEVLLFFVPHKEDASETVQLPLARGVIKVERDGTFRQTVELRRDRTATEPQQIRAVVNRPVGLPRPSETFYDTLEKIIETVFLALIATTLGVIISIPISFLAAQNLMTQVKTMFGSFVATLAAAPLGWYVGAWLFEAIGGTGARLIAAGEGPVAAILWGPAVVLLLSVQALASRDDQWGGWLPVARSSGLGILGFVAIALAWGLIAGLGKVAGQSLQAGLGDFGFLGNFLFVISDALITFIPVVGGFIGLFAFISFAGLLSENFLNRTGDNLPGKVFSVIMAFLAGVVVLALPALLLNWLYNFGQLWNVVAIPALAGGVILAGMALVVKADQSFPSGTVIYYITRTILNVLRAIEPLIMVIVFVVWVGIGPFAGVLALTLHTIASLGKLYSEQVENISQGPLEAVTATGANRLQTIIYAVIPQIVPPYIAFTIYRWDINVRMSTIIGFGGGGGIGFLLLQNLNLLKYRQASVQILAIAIVVALLDFVSAKIRERIL
jgi:phosphonate ABC transporter permease subunit PhnE